LAASETALLSPDLTGFTSDERRIIESQCSTERTLRGIAAYNQCLIDEIAETRAGPPAPDLTGFTSDERRIIESQCSTERTLRGIAAYNQCLIERVRDL